MCHLRPLKKGTIIDYCGHRATVVIDYGPGNKIDVSVDGMRMLWHWHYDGAECKVISLPSVECNCGNPDMGFDCTCEWTLIHPGDMNYSCESCGIYKAGEARCNQCEAFEGTQDG